MPDRVLQFRYSEPGVKRFFLLLVSLELLLVLLYGLDVWAGKPYWFLSLLLDLDGERSIAAWWSATQLFLNGSLLTLLALAAPQRPRPGGMTQTLALVALGFFFLSADEALSLHERVSQFGKQLAWLPRFRGGHGLWVFVYAALGLLLTLLLSRSLLAWWRRTPLPLLRMALGFALLVLGGVVLEVAGFQWLRDRNLPLLYALEVALEEGLEMLGGSLMLWGATTLAAEELGLD